MMIFDHLREFPDSEEFGIGLMDTMGVSSIQEARVHLIRHFDKISQRIVFSITDSEVVEEYLEVVDNLKVDVIVATGSEITVGEFLGGRAAIHMGMTLRMIRGGLKQAGSQSDDRFDREKFRSDTMLVLEEIKESSLDEYPKRVLMSSLRMILRMTNEESLYSEDYIRVRIKSVYADFCSEFENIDRDFETTREMLTRWARGALGIGAFALALTADVSEIAGAIGVSEPKRLPSPSSE